MIKASTAILFILMTFVHTVPESEKENYRKAVHNNFKELTDVKISNNEAVNIIIKKIEDVLLLDVEGGQLSPADKLSFFLSSSGYLKNEKNKPREMSHNELEEQSKELSKMISTFEDFKIKYDLKLEGEALKVQIKKDLITEAKTAIDIFLGKLHLRLINEIYSQFSESKETSKVSEIYFKYTTYKELANHVLKEIKNKVEKTMIDMNRDKQETKDMIEKLTQDFREVFESHNSKILYLAKQLTVLFIKPEENLKYMTMYLVKRCAFEIRKTESIEDQQLIANEHHDRIQLLIEVLRNLSTRSTEEFLENNEFASEEKEEEIDWLFNYIISLKSHYLESEVMQSNSVFLDFIKKIEGDLLEAMLPIRSQGKVQKNAAYILTEDHQVYMQNDILESAISSSFEDSAFNPVVDTEINKDVAQKLRNIDYLLNMKDLSEENFAGLVHNFYWLTRIDVKRRNLLFNIKALLLAKENVLKNEELFNIKAKLFNIKLYDNLLEFVASVNEEEMNNNVFELFDKYVDRMFLTSENQWFQVNYLVVKLLNLAHITKESSYETTFAKYTQESRCSLRLIEVIKKDTGFAELAQKSYQAITKDSQKSPQTVNLMAGLYSGSTYAAKLFSMIELEYASEKTLTELKCPRAYKINVHFIEGGKKGSAKGPSGETSYSSEDSHRQGKDSLNKQKLDNGVQSHQEHNDSPIKKEDLIAVDNLHKSPKSNKNNLIPRQFEVENLEMEIPRIKSGERDNLVYEVVGKLPSEHLQALKHAEKVEDFVNNHSVVVTKNGVETTYVFVRVVRKGSPCHPGKMGGC